MKRSQLGGGLLPVLAGVGVVGGLIGGGVLGAQISERVKSVEQTVGKGLDAAVLAVPGERYLRLIDALHGKDEDARKEAQAFLSSLGGIKLEKEYEASAAFGFDNKNQAMAQIAALPVVSPDVLTAYMESTENLMPIASTISPAPLQAELRERMIASRVEGTLKSLALLNECQAALRQDSEPELSCKPWGGMVPTAQADFAKQGLREAATIEVDAALAAFHRGGEPATLGSSPKTVAWRPLRHFVVAVMMTEADLKLHAQDACISDGVTMRPDGGAPLPKGKGCIRVWVHEKGNPNAVAYTNGVFEIAYDEFMKNPPLSYKFDGSTVRYAYKTADPSNLLDAAAFERLQEYSKLHAGLNKGAKPDDGRKSWLSWWGRN